MTTIDQCLLRRGFLLETTPSGNRRLSEDAHAEDAEDLRRLLEECGHDRAAGFQMANGEFAAGIPADEKVRRTILTAWPRAQNETGYLGEQEEWPAFRRLEQGIKVPVRRLEPGVALLVKALNAVGAVTWCSCETHGEICFLGPYAAAWANFLLVEWGGADPAVLVFNGTVLTVRMDGRREPGDQRRALMAVTGGVAERIYGSRAALRRLRAVCVHRWAPDQPPAADTFFRGVKKDFSGIRDMLSA